MQITEMMSTEKFDRTCEAGVELLKELQSLLKKFNLAEDQAVNVMAVACGGVCVSGNVPPDMFIKGVELSCKMWTVDHLGDGLNGASFDPPHLRDGFDRSHPRGQN